MAIMDVQIGGPNLLSSSLKVCNANAHLFGLLWFTLVRSGFGLVVLNSIQLPIFFSLSFSIFPCPNDE